MYNEMSFNVGNDDYCILIGLINKLKTIGIEVVDTAIVHPRAKELDNMSYDEKIRFAEESLLFDFQKFKAEDFGFQKM